MVADSRGGGSRDTGVLSRARTVCLPKDLCYETCESSRGNCEASPEIQCCTPEEGRDVASHPSIVGAHLFSPLCHILPLVHVTYSFMHGMRGHTSAVTMSSNGHLYSHCHVYMAIISDGRGCGFSPRTVGVAKVMRSGGSTSGTPPTLVLTTCNL